MNDTNATTPVAIRFTVQEWQTIANVLADGTFRVVAPLLSSLQRQVEEALRAQAPAAPTAPPS